VVGSKEARSEEKGVGIFQLYQEMQISPLESHFLKAWSDDEDIRIVQLHQELGNNWIEIARLMPGRTHIAIRDRWNSAIRRREPEEKLTAYSSLSIASKSILYFAHWRCGDCGSLEAFKQVS
jgi:hypothetical protein